MKWPLLVLVRAYRAGLSPFTGQRCRYYPSCSVYAEEAIALHGAAKGGALAAWRLLRCNPWTPGGVDLVPGSRFLEEHPDLPASIESTARPLEGSA